MKLHLLCAAFACLVLAGGAWAQSSTDEKPPGVSADNSTTNATDYLAQAWSSYGDRHFRDARAAFEQAVSLDPTNARAYYGLGSSHFALGEFGQAANTFKQYVALKPGATGYFWLGESLFRARSYTNAIEAFRKTVEVKPSNALAHFHLGESYYRLNALEDAEKEYRQTIKIDPTNSHVRAALGDCLYQLKSYQEAANEFREAIRFEPTSWYSHQALGDCLYQLKWYQEALDEFRLAAKYAPASFEARLGLGDTLLRLRQFPEAADAYLEAIRIDPRNFRAWHRRGIALTASLQFPEALPNFEKAYELNKTDHEVKRGLFVAYMATSEFGKAAALYPVGYDLGVGLLLASFGLGSALLLRRSFRESADPTPGLLFSICWILVCFEGQLAFAFVAGLFGLTFASGSLIVGMLAAPLPLFIAAVAAFPRQPWGQPFARPRSLPWKPFAIACLGMLLINAGTAGFAKLIAAITHKPVPDPTNLPFIKNMIGSHPVLAVLAGVILGPAAEEVMFRGLLFGAVRNWLNPAWTIVITAVIFAAIHGDFHYFVPLIAIGAVLGWLRHRTESVWLCAAIHILNNAIAFTGT